MLIELSLNHPACKLLEGSWAARLAVKAVQFAATIVFCAERTFQAPSRFSITCLR